MRILVTGGAGFIGSHVVDGYLAQGHDVAVVDNLSTGSTRNLSSTARLYQLDLRSPELRDVFADFRPELVNHHAAQANVPASVLDPVEDASINVLGGLNLLRQAATFETRKVIYASSGGAMYGEPEPSAIPLDEGAPVRPLSPYGASKQALEAWLGVFQRTFGLDYTVLRYANVYGPRQGVREEGAVVAVFATRMAADQTCTIEGTGEQTRDFVFVKDVVAANLAAVEHGSGAAVNIGTGSEISVRGLFELMAEVVGHTRQPTFGPGRKGDVQRIALNPSKAEQVLGWRARVPLAGGLRETYQYFQDHAG